MSRDTPRDVPLESLLDLIVTEALDLLRGAEPGTIVSYDATKQRASVQPAISRAYLAEDDTRVSEQQPQLHDVPVMFLRSSGGGITVPVAAGDSCLILRCEGSIARWKAGVGGDPGDDRRHDESDAIAIVGLWAAPPGTAPTDAVLVDAPVGKLLLGGSDAAGAVVVQSALDAFGAALNSAIAACLAEPTPNALGADALTKLQSALGISPVSGQGWSAGTTVAKAK